MNNELIVRINIISNTQEYWQTNNPVLAIGDAAHVIGQDSSIIKVGNGKDHWADLPDTHIDSYVAQHSAIHAANGRDPLLATDAEVTAGTSTTRAITVKQFKAALNGNVTLPKFTISSAAASGTGVANQIWIQYL